jgi:hypothetical protein
MHEGLILVCRTDATEFSLFARAIRLFGLTVAWQSGYYSDRLLTRERLVMTNLAIDNGRRP